MTYRGHSAAITSVLISDQLGLVFSASIDSSIRIWKQPPTTRDPYGPYDPSLAVQTLVGHTDAIWGLCLLPTSASSTAPLRRKGKDVLNGLTSPARLASCSTDGSVKIWTKSNGDAEAQWTLECSITGFGNGVVPTCVAPFHPNYTKILVGRSDGTIGLYDIDSAGQEKVMYGSCELRRSLQAYTGRPVLTNADPAISHRIHPVLPSQLCHVAPELECHYWRLRRWPSPDIRP